MFLTSSFLSFQEMYLMDRLAKTSWVHFTKRWYHTSETLLCSAKLGSAYLAPYSSTTHLQLLQENITVSARQGGKLQGNASRKLLQCMDSLELELSKCTGEQFITGMPYIRALRAFNMVVTSCFGSHLLQGWQGHLAEFTDSYRALRSRKDKPISITPKVGNLSKPKYTNSSCCCCL